LENGQTFTLKAENASKDNIYIQSVTLNGKPYSKNYISHKDIVHGGEMIFKMDDTPNRDWGNSPTDCPTFLVKIP
jgi:putative alpha-1,2-mannosidase